MKRPEVAKWFFKASLRDNWIRHDRFTRTLRVTCIKLLHEPPEGVEPLHGEDYKGVDFSVNFWFPVYVGKWR